MKKIILLMSLFVLMFQFASAQKLVDSFRHDYLSKMYQSCPDSLKEYMNEWQTARGEYTFKSVKALEKLEEIIERREKERPVLLRYRSDDFYAYVRYASEKGDFQFDFYYISPHDSVCCLRLMETTGHFKREFSTKSGSRYSIDHEWGFMDIKKDNLGLLSCFLQLDKSANFVLIPFKGTNTMVWSRKEQGQYVPAF